ncbi:hypothetical protein A9995_07035 [Erythrobacter sp. QSSC1-22B]|nr:hypothetical protein A9995_07035 [Erythrobacter sp. QSSC1-22B]
MLDHQHCEVTLICQNLGERPRGFPGFMDTVRIRERNRYVNENTRIHPHLVASLEEGERFDEVILCTFRQNDVCSLGRDRLREFSRGGTGCSFRPPNSTALLPLPL